MTEASSVLDTRVPDAQWVVVHCRPRCEKKVKAFAELRGIVCFLPLRTSTHRYGARVRSFENPLFPGYLFCLVSRDNQRWLRQHDRVANVLEVEDQATLIRQLHQIEAALDSGQALEVLPFIEKGKWVRIVQGPCKGLEGFVQEVKGQTRVVLNVDFIRESVVIEVEAAWLGPMT